jgi:hypothetical protein
MQKYNEKDVIMKRGSKIVRELSKHGWEHGYDNLRFWPAGYSKDYAVSMHMTGNDRWEEFDANVVFVLGEYGKKQTKLLGKILDELKEPVVLTIPLAVPANQQNFFKRLGLVLFPARWTNNLEEFDIYIKGQMNMGGFVNLMERVAHLSSYAVNVRRPLPIIFLSFLAFRSSTILRKTTKLPCGNHLCKGL